MRILFAGLAFLAPVCLCAGPAAVAQLRPSTTNMACKAAAALINRQGAAVLATGKDLYDRYVRSQAFCPTGTFARPAFAPTRDNPQCMIGYYCSYASPLFRF